MDNREFDQCMRRIQQGDKNGLREVYEGYISYIYAIILGIVKSRENAEDLTAEFFIRLWDTADSYRPGGGHRAWMTVMARNMAIDFMRKASREQLVEELPDDRPQDMRNSMEDAVVGRMNFRQTVEKLANIERQIVIMKLAGQMTFKEIAGVLDIPIGTVTWKYQKSMEQLRRAGI